MNSTLSRKVPLYGKAGLLIIFMLVVAFAHGNETFEVAEGILSAELPCSQLTDDQLEDLGDYYMEQMHPGESHELMDEMMGGEGSESLRDMHIAMARRLYCGDTSDIGYGMMGYGMMNGYGGMMSGYTATPAASLTYYLFVALLIGLVILVYRQIFKSPIKGGKGGKK